MLLALAMILALCVPALAAGDSPVRLTQVDIYSDGMLYQHYELSYYEGTQLREQRVATYWPETKGLQYDTSVTTYSEQGLTQTVEGTFVDNGETVSTAKQTCTYDGNGDMVESVNESVDYGTERSSTNTYTYTYDDGGNLLSSTQYTDGEENMTREYTYDGQGRVLTINNRVTVYGWSYLNEYTYDDQDRVITNRVTYDNGAPGSYWVYSYEPDAYFELRYSLQYQDDPAKLKPANPAFYAEIPAAEGRPGLSFGLHGTPMLSYNADGYLARADAGEGNYIEFTYEPAA